MNWDAYRRADGSIDLYKAWLDNPHSEGSWAKAEKYLRIIEAIQPISSRQAAAQALATATVIAKLPF